MDKPHGALVSMVTPDSPAKEAKLLSGDVIIALDGVEVKDYHELPIRISQMAPGTKVDLLLFRDGKELKKTLKLGIMPSDDELSERRATTDDSQTILGMTVRDVNATDIEKLGLDQPVGALVTEIQTGSPAEYGGVQPGDVVLSIKYNGKSNEVNRTDQLRDGVKEALDSKAEVLVIVVVRDGNRLLLALEPETR